MHQADKDEGSYASGYLGHRTGHWANELGYQARQREQELDAAFHKRQNDALTEWHARKRAAPAPPPPASGAYLEGSVLDAVSRILEVLGALTLVDLGYRQAILPPVWAGAAVDWAARSGLLRSPGSSAMRSAPTRLCSLSIFSESP